MLYISSIIYTTTRLTSMVPIQRTIYAAREQIEREKLISDVSESLAKAISSWFRYATDQSKENKTDGCNAIQA
jgi:hypothetical protein